MGETIVLLHGLMASPHAWDPILALLDADAHVEAVALPWHLGSERPVPDTPTFDEMLDQLEADLVAAGLGDAHLVGNSLGGYLALELARRGRARSVVAISPAAGWRSPSDIRRVVRLLGFGHRLQTFLAPHAALVARSGLLRRIAFGMGVDRPGRLSPEAIAGALTAVAHCHWARAFMRDAERRGPLPPALDLPVPVTVAWAERDRVLPFERHGRPLLDNLPAVRVVTLPRCGHVPMSDDPELVARVVTDAIDALVQ